MKYSCIFALLIVSCTTSFAQIVVKGKFGGGYTPPAPVPLEKSVEVEGDVIDKSKLIVVYEFTCKTQDKEGKDVTDLKRLVLQIGDKVQKCYSYEKYLQTYEAEKVTDSYLSMENLSNEENLFISDVWTNFPEGKVTTRDAIFPNFYETETKKPSIKWTLKDGASEQCGYTCNEAECEFHGKTWTVYYTEEVPTTAGPWKLGGLPGLIVRAIDAEGIHEFTLVQLENASTSIIFETEPAVVKVSEKKLIEYKQQIYGNPKYLQDVFHYAPDWTSHVESIDVFKSSSADSQGTVSINGGKFFMNMNPHVYQPLELK